MSYIPPIRMKTVKAKTIPTMTVVEGLIVSVVGIRLIFRPYPTSPRRLLSFQETLSAVFFIVLTADSDLLNAQTMRIKYFPPRSLNCLVSKN